MPFARHPQAKHQRQDTSPHDKCERLSSRNSERRTPPHTRVPPTGTIPTMVAVRPAVVGRKMALGLARCPIILTGLAHSPEHGIPAAQPSRPHPSFSRAVALGPNTVTIHFGHRRSSPRWPQPIAHRSLGVRDCSSAAAPASRDAAVRYPYGVAACIGSQSETQYLNRLGGRHDRRPSLLAKCAILRPRPPHSPRHLPEDPYIPQ